MASLMRLIRPTKYVIRRPDKRSAIRHQVKTKQDAAMQQPGTLTTLNSPLFTAELCCGEAAGRSWTVTYWS
ncbi:Uncharacterised protein [Citrobacter koseri]|nr:Uncharacterised protein [Citrobacter koseri]